MGLWQRELCVCLRDVGIGAGLYHGDGPIGESEVLLQYSSLQCRDRRGE